MSKFPSVSDPVCSLEKQSISQACQQGTFSFAENSCLEKKDRRKHLVETVKEDKNLQVDFGVPGALYHGDTLNVK